MGITPDPFGWGAYNFQSPIDKGQAREKGLGDETALWVHVDVIATLNSTIVSPCFFVLAFATTHPLTPTPLYTLAQY